MLLSPITRLVTDVAARAASFVGDRLSQTIHRAKPPRRLSLSQRLIVAAPPGQPPGGARRKTGVTPRLRTLPRCL
jgi:hypothetical protein